MGAARASYWALRHCPIADSPRRLWRVEFNLLGEGWVPQQDTITRRRIQLSIWSAAAARSRIGRSRHFRLRPALNKPTRARLVWFPTKSTALALGGGSFAKTRT